MPQLDNLIQYLEDLTKSPEKQENQLATVNDYNKDYTALLLNCYVKKEKYKEIEFYIKEATDEKHKDNPKRIFDIPTAIDVCREHK